jgi:iron complex outermembrane receptor protein
MKRSLLLGFCLMLGVLSAHAEEVADLGRIVVTPNRIAEDAGSASSNLTVITQEMIVRSNARTVADVLEREPGIHIYNKGSAKTTVVDLRGYGDTATSNVLVLVNGRRTNPVDISGADLLQVPLGSVERIEIIRGGASTLYGDNATGGVINIITKEGAGSPAATVFAEAGSYGAQKYGTEISGGKKGLSYNVYSEYSDTKGYRDNSQVLTKDETARLSYDINDQVKVGIEGGWHEDDYGLAGGLSDFEIEQYGRRGTANPEDYGNTKDRFIRLSADVLPFDGEHGKLTADISRRNRDTYGWYDYGMWGATATKRDIQTDAFGLKYAVAPKVLDRNLSLVTGVDYTDAQNHILGSGAGMSASTDDLTITKKELGVYALGEYEIMDSLFLNAGARHERAKYIFDRYDMPFYTTQNPQETLFSGGMKYEYAKRSNVFVSAQQTFRFLATDEWYDTWSGLNTGLKQQTGMEYQAGVKHAVSDAWDVEATPFYAINHNEIFLDPTLGGAGKNSNYDRTRRVGIDLGQTFHAVKLIPFSGLSRADVFTNYTYQEPTFDGGKFSGKIIPMAPQHALTVGIDMGWKGGFSWNLAARYTGSQYAINDTANTTARVKPYVVVDTKFAYKMKNGAEVYLDYFPAPERNYVAGVKYKF